jgi:hypothetical protein
MEQPWLLNDDNYDFSYQQTRLLHEEVKLYPGDHLTLGNSPKQVLSLVVLVISALTDIN